MPNNKSFEETYPHYAFSELVRLGIKLAEWFARPTLVPRVADLLDPWSPRNQLKKRLAELSDEELDHTLASGGRNRADLFTVFEGNARHRQLLAKMIEHFGVDLDHATRNHWDALKHADGICAQCANTKRCRNWLACGSTNDAPRIFCPNAELFRDIVLTASGARLT